jgi:hypothetical protein
LPRSRSWSDDDLQHAVAAARSLAGVFTELGLRVGGSSWTAMKAHIRRLDLDTSHWRSDAVRSDTARELVPIWTDQQVRDAHVGARSVAEMMRRLGLDPERKRGRRQLERRMRELGLDPGVLPGQGWAAGRRRPGGGRPARPLEEVLVRGSTYGNTSKLKRRLVDAGLLEWSCAQCGISAWQGVRAPLHLDHRDGDRRNNLLENLRLLCPNCHALTETYCGRNISARYSPVPGEA